MKRLPILLLIIVLAALAISAYIARNPSVIRINEADAGKTIELSTGDTLELSLEGNPTTGYTWEVLSGQALLEQMSEVEFSAASQQLVGSSGQMLFKFEAVAAGETILEMAYLRPFERDVEPLQSYSINIFVK